MSRRFSGGTCVHNGCCDGLPYCGGSAWVNAYVQCAGCGREMHYENAVELNGRDYCEDCAANVEEEAEEEES